MRSTAVQAAGGAAVLDVAAALGWVRRNVAAFGGDPRRVALAGHAAGAALVNALLMLPDSKGEPPWILYKCYHYKLTRKLILENDTFDGYSVQSPIPHHITHSLNLYDKRRMRHFINWTRVLGFT